MTEIEKLTAGHPDTQSADIVAGNIEALRALFPEAFTEGKIDFEVLKQCLGGTVDDREEKYGLNWHGKRRARQIALTPSTGTLLPCPEDSVDWDTTQNLMIEGDNLEVLKLLQKSYAGKVKAIYIDPPYNTGKDFVYPDNFHDSVQNYLKLTGQIEGGAKVTSNAEASGRFHTDWLNMIYPRIKIAHSMLRADGVIFVSIDDSEVANLKTVLNEIFGEENFIDTIAVEMSTTSGPKTVNAQQGTIVKNVEFVHIYRKSAEFDRVNRTPLLDGIDSYDTHYSIWMNDDGTLASLSEKMEADPIVGEDIVKYGLGGRGGFSVNNLNKLLSVSESAKDFLEKNLKSIARVDRPPVSAEGKSTPVGRWLEFEVDHRSYFLTTLANGTLQALMPLSLNYRMSDDYKPRFGRTVIRGDLWKGFHQDMGNVAKEGEIQFPNGKKPVRLIKQLVKWADSAKDGLILDFFAGSGTTGHSVMQLNSEDGGRRRFILVQLPEVIDTTNTDQKAAADLCDKLGKPRRISELTKERLRRAGRKISAEMPKGVELDAGFRVLKLGTSNITAWNPDVSDLEGTLLANSEHLVPGRTEADILTELLLKLGLDLCVPIETKDIAGKSVHSVGAGALIVCLSDGITRETVEGLAQGIIAWWQALAPAGDTRVVFKDSAFADDVAKTNMAAILNQAGIKDMRSL